MSRPEILVVLAALLMPLLLPAQDDRAGGMTFPPEDLLCAKGKVEVKAGLTVPRPGQDAYWRMPEGAAGNFYPSFRLQSGTSGGEEYLRESGILLLNGKPILFATATGPEKQGGAFLCEFRADRAIAISPGDEIRLSATMAARQQLAGTLFLEPTPRAAGPIHLSQWLPVTLLTDIVRGEVSFASLPSAGAPGHASIRLSNMTGQTLTASLVTQVVEYHQARLGGEKTDVSLAPHASATYDIPFTQADTDRYRKSWSTRPRRCG
jgi:hypothetical protein